jgi:hypothetical protein
VDGALVGAGSFWLSKTTVELKNLGWFSLGVLSKNWGRKQ